MKVLMGVPFAGVPFSMLPDLDPQGVPHFWPGTGVVYLTVNGHSMEAAVHAYEVGYGEEGGEGALEVAVEVEVQQVCVSAMRGT
jgi:hypothetical protein